MTHVPESGADTGNDKPTHSKAVVPDTVVSELGAEKSDKKWGFGGSEDFAWNALVFSPVQEIIAKPEARVYSWAGNGVSQSLARESFPGSVGSGSYLFNPYDNRGDRGQPFVPLRTAFNTDTGMRQSVVEALSVPRLQGNDLISALEVLRGMPAVTGQIEPVVVKPLIETSTASSTDQQNQQQQYKLVPNPDTGEMQLVVTDGTGQQRTIAVTKALDTKDQVVLGNGTAIDIPKDVRIKGPDAINTYVQKQSEQLKDKPVEFSLTQNGEPLTIVKRADGTLAVLSKTTDFKDVEQAVLKANKEPVTGIPAGDGIAQPARQVLFKPNEAAAQEGDKKLRGLPNEQLDAKVPLPGGQKEPTISRNLYETGYNAGQSKAQMETSKSAGFVPKPLTFNEVFSGSGNALSIGPKGGPVGAGLNSGGVGSVDRSIGTRGQLIGEIAPKLVGQAGAAPGFNPGFNPANLKDAAPKLQQAGANYINKAEMIRTQSSAVQVKEQTLLNSGLPTDPYAKLQRLHDLREGALDPKPLATSGSGRITTAGAEKQTDLKSVLQRLQEQKLSPPIKEQLGQQSVQRSLTKELPGQPGYRPTGDLTLKNDGVTQRQLTALEKGRLPTGTQTGQFSSERPVDAKLPNTQAKLQPTMLDTNGLAARLQGKLNPEQKAALMQKEPAPAGKTDTGALAPKPEKGTGFAPPARSLGADNGTGSFSATALDKMGSGIKNIPANDRLHAPQTKVEPRTEQMREQTAQRKVNGERPNTAPTADLTKTNKVTSVERVQPPQKVQGSEKTLVQQPLLHQADRNPRLVKQNDGKPVDLKPIADAMSRPIKQGDTNLQGKLTTPPQRLDGLRPQPFDMTKVTSQVGKLNEANLGKIRDALAQSNDVTKGARTGDGSAYTPIKISRNFGSEAASKTIAIKGDKVVDLPNRKVTDEAKVAKSYTTNTPLDLSSKRLVDKPNNAATDIRTAGNTTIGKRSDVLALAPKLDSAKTKAALTDVSRGLTAAKATDAARILTGRKEQAVTGDKSYTVRLNTNNIKQIAADRALVPGTRNQQQQQQQQADKGLRLVGDKVSKTPTARLADVQTAARRPVETQIAISPKTLADKQIASGRALSDKIAGTRVLIEKGTGRALTDKVINNALRVLGDRSAIRLVTNNDRGNKTAGSERQIASKDNHQTGSRQNIAADRQPAIVRNLADNNPKAGRTTGDQTAAAGRRVTGRPDLHIAAARAEKAASEYVVRIVEKGTTNPGDRLPQLTPARAHELIGKAIRTESHATGEKGSRIAGTKDLSEKALATRDKGQLKGLLQLETKTGKFTINIDSIKRDVGEKKVKHDDYALRDGALNCADKRYLTGIELLLAGLATISAVARMRADQTTAKSVDEGRETQDALPGLTIENWDGDEEEETLLELAVKRGLMGNIDRSTILTRPKYMIQPGDTLTSIAEEVMHDSMLGWLILHINAGSIKTQWEGDICLSELELRQEIELPVAQDIVEFYRSRPNLRYKNKRLVTTQKQNTFDRELLVNNFRNVIAGATARKAQDLPAV